MQPELMAEFRFDCSLPFKGKAATLLENSRKLYLSDFYSWLRAADKPGDKRREARFSGLIRFRN